MVERELDVDTRFFDLHQLTATQDDTALGFVDGVDAGEDQAEYDDREDGGSDRLDRVTLGLIDEGVAARDLLEVHCVAFLTALGCRLGFLQDGCFFYHFRFQQWVLRYRRRWRFDLRYCSS
ncbi:hypothetical protein D3C71_1450050 [compost metagenome]